MNLDAWEGMKEGSKILEALGWFLTIQIRQVSGISSLVLMKIEAGLELRERKKFKNIYSVFLNALT